MAHGPLVLYSAQTNNGFYISKWLGKNKQNILPDMKIMWLSNFSVHKYLLKHRQTHSFICQWLLWTQWQSRAVVKVTRWPAKPKTFTIWLFSEKVCQILFYSCILKYLQVQQYTGNFIWNNVVEEGKDETR